MNRAELPADEAGAQSLRGIPFPVRTYRARRSSNPEGPPFGHRPGPNATVLPTAAVARPAQRGLMIGGVLGAVVLGALLVLGGVSWWRGAVYRRAEDALVRAKPDEALLALKVPLSQKPPPPRALDLAGRAALLQRDYPLALDKLRDAAKADPDFRPDLLNACLQALAQPAKRDCPIRRQAIALLVSIDAVEARKELQALVKDRGCGAPEADAALKALPSGQ
jgi:hypothetical protein